MPPPSFQDNMVEGKLFLSVTGKKNKPSSLWICTHEEHCKIDELKHWNDNKNAIEQNLNRIKGFKNKKKWKLFNLCLNTCKISYKKKFFYIKAKKIQKGN